jgi:CubicO group peptidase (beta-lactamase class C family)
MPLILICIISLIIGINTISFSQSSGLDAQLLSIKNNFSLVGMSVIVVKNNIIVYSKGFGLRDISRILSVNDSTIYRIASISKFISAAALLKLYDEGLFQLDDDVSDYLGFTLRNPSFPNDTITFSKILSHTSSLRDGSGYNSFLSASYNDNPPPSIQSLLTQGGQYFTTDMFSSNRSPSLHYFTYANINYGVVGTLVEKISNRRFDIYCREEIFQPLEMTSSYNIQDLPDINNVAVLYRKVGNNWIPQADNYGGIKLPPRDLSKFMLMIMNGGTSNGIRILEDSTAALITEPQWVYTGTNGNNYYGIFNTYGLGSSRTNDLLPNETLYGHPGEAYGLISDLYFSKLKDYGIIFVTNGGQWGNGSYSGWYNIEEDVYQACYNYLDSLTVGIKEEITPETGFNLYQNYPNPFNPKTKISFNVRDIGLALSVLRIYDILGNEVTTLLNEYKAPGKQEI